MSAKMDWKVFNGQVRQLTKDKRIQLEIAHDFIARERLFALIQSEVEPTFEAIRKADAYTTSGPKSILENSLELYKSGNSHCLVEGAFKLHRPSGSVDCELNETEKALVYCASRNESPDKPI